MLMNDSVRRQAEARLKALPNPVRLVVFTQEMECALCRENRQLVEELAALAPEKLRLDVYNLITDPDRAREFGVDKVPAICVVGERDHGIRFYGVPAGFEFTSFLAAIELVAGRDSRLAPATRQQLAALAQPVDLQVFVTLTCPACPSAVTLAHRLALESDRVTAAAVDSAEFPQLAALHGVMAVPKTVVNHAHAFEGAMPEEQFVAEVLKGAAPPAAG
jgi:glutaredoxin-like protein